MHKTKSTKLNLYLGLNCLKCKEPNLPNQIFSIKSPNPNLQTNSTKFCDEKFANIPNLMNHKKIKHREKIDYCKNFNKDGCPFEDRKCWFLHTKNNETFKCNLCEQTFSEKSEFMKHRKDLHPEMVKICRNTQCFYENECWFRHENDNSKLNNIKTNENEKLIEKLVGLVEKLNERVSTLEKKE